MKSRFLFILERDELVCLDSPCITARFYLDSVVVVYANDDTEENTYLDTPAQAEGYVLSLGVDTDSIGWY